MPPVDVPGMVKESSQHTNFPRGSRMEFVAFVTALALLEYAVFGMLVGRARGRYGVNAPATAGHPVFERYFRVHYNTMEQLVTFLPALWLFATYVDATWAGWLGVVFVVGRLAYLLGYVADPKRREIGFALTALPVVILLAGALWGTGRALL
jgi:uncharacterized membrane protein YecN with MAPEG domain